MTFGSVQLCLSSKHPLSVGLELELSMNQWNIVRPLLYENGKTNSIVDEKSECFGFGLLGGWGIQ